LTTQRVTDAERRIEQLTSENDELEQKYSKSFGHAREDLRKKRDALQTRLAGEQRGLVVARRMEQLARNYMPVTPFATLLLALSLLLAGTLLKGIFLAVNEILVTRLIQRTTFDLRKHLFRRILDMDIDQLEENRSSGLMSRLTNDVSHVTKGLNAVFGKSVREPLKLFVCLCGAAAISWRMLIIALLVAPLGIFLVRHFAMSLKRNSVAGMTAMSALYGRMLESFSGIRLVKAYNMQRYERRKFHYVSKQILQRRMRVTMIKAFIKPTVEFITLGAVSVTILVGAYLLLHREMSLFGIPLTPRPLTASSLMMFFGFLVGASDPAQKLSDISMQLRRSTAAANRVFKLADRTPTIAEPAQPLPLPQPILRIVIDDVDFKYSKGDFVLKNFQLTIRSGERLALIGPNGCGKSTLTNLILRFYDPYKGSIRIDDIDLRQFRIRELRNQIAVVPQETLLFDDSVMNNIRYGSPHATDDDVRSAARDAHADEFIRNELDCAYGTIVGEKGCWLSGGQRQRIALARAFLRNPQILILDEATSHIDIKSEHLIYDAIAASSRDRMVIIVTHCTAALRIADRIVSMNDGQVIHSGTHEQLLARDPWYGEMIDK
jgi:ATP-binding cassette subfamily B protein/subfamily B ATP-binding cassette protein MsbA